jgi:hypothetical protein
MGGMPSPKHYEVLLPVKRSVEAPAFRTFGEESGWFSNETRSYGQQASHRPLPRLLMMFFLGSAATLAWQSYGRAARELIATLYPQFSWLAPQAADTQAAPDRIEQISRSFDRIAREIAASNDQMTRSINLLAADHEQMTREIIRLHAISQYTYKNQEPPLQPASGSARKAIHRSSQTR